MKTIYVIAVVAMYALIIGSLAYISTVLMKHPEASVIYIMGVFIIGFISCHIDTFFRNNSPWKKGVNP